MALDEQAIMQKVAFLVGRVMDERDAKLEKRMEDLEKRQDAKALGRAQEVRASLAVQPFMPTPTNHYYGTAVPSRALGETRDTYDRLDGSGLVLSKYLKTDGVWTLVGTFSSGVAYVTDMTGGPHTDYGTLAGAVDGANALFTRPSPYIAGSITAYWQGQTLFAGAGLTETDPAAGTITLDIAPSVGDVVATRAIND